jgi:hypothetical protein
MVLSIEPNDGGGSSYWSTELFVMRVNGGGDTPGLLTLDSKRLLDCYLGA